MVTMAPDRARAFIRAVNEDRRVANERSAQADRHEVNDVVYYIQFRDMIKIGTTRSLDSRLSMLPWETLLALEPGGRIVEQHRHRQLRLDRYLNEWFRPGIAVTNHIADVNERNTAWRDERFPGLALPYRNPALDKHAHLFSSTQHSDG